MPKIDEPWDSHKSKPPGDQSGSGLRTLLRSNRISMIVMFTLFVLWVFYLTCTTYVGPGEFGIKQVLYSPFGLFGSMGTQNRIYETAVILQKRELAHQQHTVVFTKRIDHTLCHLQPTHVENKLSKQYKKRAG